MDPGKIKPSIVVPFGLLLLSRCSLNLFRNQQPDSFYPEKSHLPSPLPAKLRLPVAAAAPVIKRNKENTGTSV